MPTSQYTSCLHLVLGQCPLLPATSPTYFCLPPDPHWLLGTCWTARVCLVFVLVIVVGLILGERWGLLKADKWLLTFEQIDSVSDNNRSQVKSTNLLVLGRPRFMPSPIHFFINRPHYTDQLIGLIWPDLTKKRSEQTEISQIYKVNPPTPTTLRESISADK